MRPSHRIAVVLLGWCSGGVVTALGSGVPHANACLRGCLVSYHYYIAAPLLREVLQARGHLGDVEVDVVVNLDTTLPAFINGLYRRSESRYVLPLWRDSFSRPPHPRPQTVRGAARKSSLAQS